MRTSMLPVAIVVSVGCAAGVASAESAAASAERMLRLTSADMFHPHEDQPAVEVGQPSGAAEAATTGGPETAPEPADPAASPATPAPAAPVVPSSFWTGWKRSIEAGVTGSSGNTENFGARFAFKTERDVQTMKTLFGADYTYNSNDGEKTQSKGNLEARNDWKFGEDNRWRYFIRGKAEYDEFQDWDWRLSAYTGFGYELIKTDKTLFVPRIGIGASREIGGASNEIMPELDLGWDFEHKFNENVKLFNTFDFYPSLSEFGAYRFETKAGLEVLMSKENNLSLKLGVEDKYDSTPEGQKRNDVTYFAALVWAF